MNVADKLGFGPKRESRRLSDGTYEVRVTPPPMFKLSPTTIVLTADQHDRFEQWLQGCGLIQDVFPELPPSQREILQTGIGPKEWDDLFKEGDYEV